MKRHACMQHQSWASCHARMHASVLAESPCMHVKIMPGLCCGTRQHLEDKVLSSDRAGKAGEAACMPCQNGRSTAQHLPGRRHRRPAAGPSTPRRARTRPLSLLLRMLLHSSSGLA